MKTKQLGKNGPDLTIIGYGAWAIGGPWQYGWGPVDDNESVNSIKTALELGINWIDTAAAYGFGHSETVVAKAVKGMREKVFIATKCGLINDGSGNARNNLHPNSIRQEMEDSLKRLQTDHVDLYQIHWPDPAVPIEDAWGTLVELRNEGKARFIGVSNFDVPLLERCMKIERVQSLQPPFSMLKRNVEKEILPYCLQNEIGVIAYSPMQAGLLTGKFDIEKVAKDDWRRKVQLYNEPTLSKILDLVERLKPIAEKQNKSVGNLAVAWVLKNKALTAAIVGARNTEQVIDNINAAEFILSDEDMNNINELLSEFDF